MDMQNGTVSVNARTTVRFHILNMSARALLHVWFEGHNMVVIEVDGVDMVPYPTEGITIAIGQRYSVLVTMLGDPRRNYPIVAATDPEASSYSPNVTAWLIYNLAAPKPPAKTIPKFYDFDDMALEPYIWKPVAPSNRNVTITVSFDSNIGRATMNGVSYEAPEVPTLFTAMSARNPFDPSIYGQTNSFVLDYGDMIWLIIENKFFNVGHPCIPRLCLIC